MTIQKALEIIKNEMPHESGIINKALNTVENAVEKQIPKNPDLIGDGYDDNGNLIYDTWTCPCCEAQYELDYDDYKFCPECGQALDWNDLKGETK